MDNIIFRLAQGAKFHGSCENCRKKCGFLSKNDGSKNAVEKGSGEIDHDPKEGFE